jgi:acetyltransferase
MIIHRLNPRAMAELRPQLATLLLDAVADGHVVGFLAGLDQDGLESYWSGIGAEVAAGTRMVLAAERGGQLIGCAQLDLYVPPNGANRARVEQLLVHCTERRRGVGTALVQALEIEALGLRRGLLMLEAEAGSGAEQLWLRNGYTRAGELPEFACTPNGHWRAAAIYYKTLFARARR